MVLRSGGSRVLHRGRQIHSRSMTSIFKTHSTYTGLSRKSRVLSKPPYASEALKMILSEESPESEDFNDAQ